MKVRILAPNAGVSLSSGGGSNFVLKQARGLAKAGHEVELAAYHALPLGELETMHRVPLTGLRSRIRVRSAGGGRSYRTQRRLPGKPSPYLALLDPRVQRWFADLESHAPADRVWFHDDVPFGASGWAARSHSRLYVHFPLQARSARLVPPLRSGRGPGEAVQDALLRRAARRLIDPAPATWCERVDTNSTVTARVCRAVWGAKASVWPTYVSPAAPGAARRVRSVLLVGAFHRGKQLGALVEAFREVEAPDARLRIAGFARDPAYFAALRRSAASAGRGRIELRADAKASELERWRGEARVAVATADFEPFGLSVLEGMAGGATPLVRASPYSGAWTDLTEGGRIGKDFASPEDLSARLNELLAPPTVPTDRAAVDRAAVYSEAAFDARLAEALG